MQHFMEKFGFSSQALTPYYQKAVQLLHSRGSDILEFEQYRAFSELTEPVCRIRDLVKTDPDTLLYCYLVSALLEAGEDALLQAVASPCKDLHQEYYDALPLFGLLDRIPAMLALHQAQGIPEQVSRDTVRMFENQTQDFLALHGHIDICTYVTWLARFLQGKVFRIGRFNLELACYEFPYDVFRCRTETVIFPRDVWFHRSGMELGAVGCEAAEGSFFAAVTEDDDYFCGIPIRDGLAVNQPARLKKDQWHRVLTQGDAVISVHIPSGGPLTPEICDQDLAYGKALLDRCFGHDHLLFCASWLLDPQISRLLEKPTNLTRFADRFIRFPLNTPSTVYTYVWNLPGPCPPEDLPADSSLARAIRKHLLSGGYIYGACGVIL